MDPSIMKLLEEDEDETMHSGADVEAFTAALNRDIEGDTSTSLPSDSESAALSQGSNHTSSQLFQQWQTSSQDENTNYQIQEDLDGSQRQNQRSSQMELKQHRSDAENQQQQMETTRELNCMPLQQKQPQIDHQQRQAEQNALHFSQAPSTQNSENKPVHMHEPDRTQNPESGSQYRNVQKMNNQQAMNPMNPGKQVPFALLLPVIQPQLDKDRAMQLQTLYQKLKKNEISKDGFVRHMRAVVGDQMLKMAVYKLQAQSQASAKAQHLKTPPVGSHQGTIPPSFAQFHQKGVSSPADTSHIPSTAAQLKTDSNKSTMDNNGQKSREIGRQSDLLGMPASQTSSSSLSNNNQEREQSAISIQRLNKQQQHLHFSPSSFPIYGSTGSNYHPFPGNASAPSLKQQPHDSQMRQGLVHQSIGATQIGTSAQSTNLLNAPKLERHNSIGETKGVQGGNIPHLTNNSALQQNSVHWQSPTTKEWKSASLSSAYVKTEPVDQGNEQQLKSQLLSPQGSSSFSALQVEHGRDEALEMQSSRIGFAASTNMMPMNPAASSTTAQMDHNISISSRTPPAMTSLGVGNNAKTPPRKPSIGQKKPLESLGSSPPLPSKKQKTMGALSDQSIEQLNDVTAVSGVNLQEEEEQLFSGPKEESRASEASRRVVQEEEERLILQKIPLQKKLAEIMSKCGLKNMSNDVERCLSLCVEERMRGLISNLIRLSKQRVDIEKPRHRIHVTSDVRQQIMAINQKAKEAWEKKQADAERLQKLNEPEGNTGTDTDKDKDDGRVKSLKANKEEDDKMRTTAANVAARAAVGGDDMLSKWQLMAQQARQKREGGIDAASVSQLIKDANLKPPSTSARDARDNQEGDKGGPSAAAVTSGSSRKFTRNQGLIPQTKVSRTISVKDVISVLERETQMSKSTLLYRLYEKVRSNAVTE